MNLIFLKYFYDMGIEKSVTKSAAANFVSSAAISNGIRKLEAELGVELLKHGKNKIELTKEGISLLGACESIFKLLDETKVNIKEKELRLKEVTRIGITHGLNQEFWAKFLALIYEKYPTYQIIFHVGSPNQLKAWLGDKKIDFALTISRDKPSNYGFIQIHKGSFKFIMQNTKSKSAHKEKEFILTENWPEVEVFKQNYFRQYKKMPPVRFEIASWGTIRNLVAEGLGIGIVPDYQLLHSPQDIKEYKFPVKLNAYYIMALFEKGTYLDQMGITLVEQFQKFLHEESI